MKAYLRIILGKIVSVLRERWNLRLENVALRHQIAVLERSENRPQFTNVDRLFWVILSTFWARWPEAMEIVQADTVKRWRQRGFWHYLLGKGRRHRPGRPAIEPEIRTLIQLMSLNNVLWGAPRIHDELLKLGVNVCQTTVAKYMVRRPGPPSQSWRTFLRNHTRGLLTSEILPRPICRLRALRTQVAVAVNRWLTAKFRKPLSYHPAPARDIEGEPVRCQAILPFSKPEDHCLDRLCESRPTSCEAVIQQPISAQDTGHRVVSGKQWIYVYCSAQGTCQNP